MAIEPTQAPRANAFKTMVDTIVAPREALEAVRVAPTWGWALVVTVAMAAIGYYLMLPITEHAFVAGFPQMVAHNPRLAQMTPEQQQGILKMQAKFLPLGVLSVVIFIPLILLIQTVLMLIFNALGRGSAGFGALWSAAVNIGVPCIGIGYLVTALVAMLRGAASFDSIQAIQQILPTLALLAPGASVKVTALLAAVTPFTLYAAILIGLAMVVVARVPKLHAWLAGILAVLVPALFAMAFAR